MKKNIKVLVVEDEVIIADNICKTINDIGYTALEPALNYTEAIRRIKNEKPNIGILDIHLSGKKTGIDLAKEIKNTFHFPFIFLTANADPVTVSKAKEVHPDAYLVKPFSKKELFTSLEIALYNFEQKQSEINTASISKKEYLFVKIKGKFLKIDFNHITYISSSHVYIEIHMNTEKKYVVRKSLREILKKLNNSFVKVHRGFIVNIQHVDKVEQKELFIKNQQIPIGEKYRNELLEKLNSI